MNQEVEPRREREPSRERQGGGFVGLVPEAEVGAIKERWDQIKAMFVDDPGGAVRQADRLVGDAAEVMSQAVARSRSRLGGSLNQPDGPNTEELRRALRSYQRIIERFVG